MPLVDDAIKEHAEAIVRVNVGGSDAPTAYVEAKSLGGFDPTQSEQLSERVCAALEEELGLAKDRVYIEMSDAPRHLWGWNGGTFA